MNILLITLRADYGGGPHHVDLLIDNLPNEFNLFIACPQDKPYYYKWSQHPNVKSIFQLPHRKFNFIKLYNLHRFIKNNKITIIHSHGKGAGIYSRILKLINPRLKIIHTLHGFHIHEYGSLKKKFYIFIEKILSILTDRFINVSNGEREICLNYNIYPKHKSVVIYNGIHQINRIDRAKEELKLQNKFIITTISRFDYPKNMFFAYEIAKKFKDNQNIIFLWLGDGHDRKILEKQANIENVNIIFTGFTKEIPLYLSATDIYLSTSRWEGLPYALIEAQSLGIPIVATNVIGNNEVVQHNKNGFLFTTLEEACNAIENLIKYPSIYNKLSKNALQHYNDNFEIQHVIKQIVREYKK